MRLLLKHIFRSIRRAPWQPLLIFLTVSLCVALAQAACCVTVSYWRVEQERSRAAADMGDLRITGRAGGSSRLLFEAPAQELVGTQGRVLGEFSLSGFCEQNGTHHTLDIAALDLAAADDFYRFSYIAYGEFHTQNLKNAAILSQETAERLGLAVGDRFTVRILENSFELQVQAIAKETGLLAQRDMLISLSGVLQTLCERMPLIASLGDGFAPCTQLWIKLDAGADLAAVRARLAQDPVFAESYVAEIEDGGEFGFLVLLQLCFMAVFLLLLLLLAGFLICGCLALLHKGRAAQYRLFAQAGASPAQLNGLFYAESLLYALIGACGGALLSFVIVPVAGGVYYWQTEPLYPGVAGMLFGLFSAPVLMLCCTALYLRKASPLAEGERLRKKVKGDRLCVVLGSALLLVLPLLFLLAARYRVAPALAGVVLCVLLLFFCAPWLLRLLARFGVRMLGRVRHARGTALLALKNLQHNLVLSHVGRMLCVFLALLFTLFFCEHSLSAQIAVLTTEIPCDLVAGNASLQAEDRLREDPDVWGCMRMTYLSEVKLSNGATAVGISLSGDTALCAPPELIPAVQPQGREIVLSKGVAARSEKKVGDEILLEVDGTAHRFVVSEILNISINFCYFDSTEIGIARDLLTVRLREDADGKQAAERLTAQLESQGALMLDPQMAFGTLPLALQGHVKLVRYGLAVTVLLGLVSCGNLFAQQYHSRRREREILSECGMSRGKLRGMLLLEGALLLLFAALLALFGAALLCVLIDAGMRAFGLVLIC